MAKFSMWFYHIVEKICSHSTCYEKIVFCMILTNVLLMYRIIGSGSKGPVITLRIGNAKGIVL
jgi:hypothetical protein